MIKYLKKGCFLQGRMRNEKDASFFVGAFLGFSMVYVLFSLMILIVFFPFQGFSLSNLINAFLISGMVFFIGKMIEGRTIWSR
jgi:uncharacterized membrane protein